MAVVPGNRMVDLDKVTQVLDASHVELAGEREFAVAFPDCEAGAEPPFGTLYDIPTVVDEGIETELPWYSGFRPMRVFAGDGTVGEVERDEEERT